MLGTYVGDEKKNKIDSGSDGSKRKIALKVPHFSYCLLYHCYLPLKRKKSIVA
jgi:hypothetical protein